MPHYKYMCMINPYESSSRVRFWQMVCFFLWVFFGKSKQSFNQIWKSWTTEAASSSSSSLQFSLWIRCLFRASRASRISSRVLRGSMMNARATVAVPSPFCREKHRKVAQRKAQQPMKAVRMCSGISAKLSNCRTEADVQWCYSSNKRQTSRQKSLSKLILELNFNMNPNFWDHLTIWYRLLCFLAFNLLCILSYFQAYYWLMTHARLCNCHFYTIGNNMD